MACEFYLSGNSNFLSKIPTDFKLQCLTLILSKLLFMYRVEWRLWTWLSFHLYPAKSGGFLILTELLFDTKYIIVIFIFPYNSFGTYLFVLILWFFKGFLEEGASGFKCKRAKKSMKMNSISIYIHQSISLELKTSKNLNIYFKGMFYISVICF